MAVVILVVVLVSAAHGPIPTSPLDAARIVIGHLVPGMPWMADGSLTAAQDQSVWAFRLPRTLLAVLAGAALAFAGAILQVTVRNPLAEPYILGISAGAGLGAVIAIVAGATAAVGIGLNAAAFIGALVTIALVHGLALQRGVIAPTRLILVGVALGSLLQALTNFLLLTTDAQNIYSLLHFILGSVSAASWGSLVPPLVAMLAIAPFVARRTRAMNALLVGDEAATALGVDVPRLRRLLLVATALLTAATVAVTGGIGFVGLVVPHVARMLVGADHRRVLPLSLLGGGAFLGACDLLARVVAEPAEIPLGILTALAGAPFFLWLMRNRSV